MGVWSDVDILKGFARREVILTPYDDERLNPASYDVCLGDEILVYEAAATPVLEQEPVRHNLRDEGGYLLCPGEFALASTVDRVALSATVAAQVAGKSSLARQGLNIHTAGWIDPGFVGQVTLELSTTVAFRLRAGMLIGQLVFLDMKSPCDSWYHTVGHYCGQEGPTETWTRSLGVNQ